MQTRRPISALEYVRFHDDTDIVFENRKKLLLYNVITNNMFALKYSQQATKLQTYLNTSIKQRHRSLLTVMVKVN